MFLVIPHVVRAEMLDPLNLREVDTGTANAIEVRHIDGATCDAELKRLRPTTAPVMVGAPPDAAGCSSNGRTALRQTQLQRSMQQEDQATS